MPDLPLPAEGSVTFRILLQSDSSAGIWYPVHQIFPSDPASKSDWTFEEARERWDYVTKMNAVRSIRYRTERLELVMGVWTNGKPEWTVLQTKEPDMEYLGQLAKKVKKDRQDEMYRMLLNDHGIIPTTLRTELLSGF